MCDPIRACVWLFCDLFSSCLSYTYWSHDRSGFASICWTVGLYHLRCIGTNNTNRSTFFMVVNKIFSHIFIVANFSLTYSKYFWADFVVAWKCTQSNYHTYSNVTQPQFYCGFLFFIGVYFMNLTIGNTWSHHWWAHVCALLCENSAIAFACALRRMKIPNARSWSRMNPQTEFSKTYGFRRNSILDFSSSIYDWK